MSYFDKHVFFCTNKRTNCEACCADYDADKYRAYMKDRVKQLGINGEGKVRVNSAGCLDRCDLGPVMVVYPEATWYSFVDEEDLDEIVESHLVNGEVVERLKVD